jgi:sugar phosphate isomerase/epimerase
MTNIGLRFGYGTNGFANHRLEDAIAIIAELGYEGVALTLDHHHLDPFADDLAARVAKVAKRLAELRLGVVIETGARYLLNPRHKHAPTLLDDDSAARLDFLKRAIDIAADLNAEAVSFWAGVRPPHVSPDEAWERLTRGCTEVAQKAHAAGVRLGFEPEPGMLVENFVQWERLRQEVGEGLQLTLDIGHCRANEREEVAQCVRRAGPYLVNVQIDDMRRGVHEHLEFGDGEIDFPPVLWELAQTGYTGLVAVELPRHCHAAPDVAARSLNFLRVSQWLGEARAAGEGGLAVQMAAAGRKVGRANAETARIRLLQSFRLSPQTLTDLYRYGDNDEKRAILRACPEPDLLRDALRSNDSRLVAAALGGPGAAQLTDAQWRQAVLKAVFMGLPLAQVHGLAERADEELGRMLDGLRKEREAAGRIMPPDAISLLERLR